ncbi:MAG TPA: hypothetical protein VMG82_05085 [Candidatus Sulfotelmatobacter sp.]|nr:hypothetical protein [Candidatus Sulfotelmatobacter sp.]
MNSLFEICNQQIRVTGRWARIASLDADKYLFLDDPSSVIEQLKMPKRKIDLFTFLQRVSEPEPKYSYPMEWDNMAVLSISNFDNWWNKQIGFKARNKAKQAEKKGVVIREVEFDRSLAKGIWTIYNETPVRQGRRFPHFGKDYDTVFCDEATYLSNSVFIGAYVGDCLIGFIKLVHDQTGTQAGLMNIVSMVAHRDKAPTNALLAQAVRSCAQRGIRHLVYSNFAYGKKQKSGLSDFKERNAFVRIDVPRYYVPLTPRGALAFRLRLHHRFVDRLPEPIAAKLREYREAWYNRRLNSAEAL